MGKTKKYALFKAIFRYSLRNFVPEPSNLLTFNTDIEFIYTLPLCQCCLKSRFVKKTSG